MIQHRTINRCRRETCVHLRVARSDVIRAIPVFVEFTQFKYKTGYEHQKLSIEEAKEVVLASKRY